METRDILWWDFLRFDWRLPFNLPFIWEEALSDTWKQLWSAKGKSLHLDTFISKVDWNFGG